MIPRRDAGFTLLEMIVVLAILGLSLVLIMARGPMHSARLDAEATARELAGSLRLARGQAIAQDRRVSVMLEANRYHVDGLATHMIPIDVALSGNAMIGFAPDGSSSGGAVVVQGPTSRIDITVDWLTGQIRLARVR